jgi:hypothetical protein
MRHKAIWWLVLAGLTGAAAGPASARSNAQQRSALVVKKSGHSPAKLQPVSTPEVKHTSLVGTAHNGDASTLQLEPVRSDATVDLGQGVALRSASDEDDDAGTGRRARRAKAAPQKDQAQEKEASKREPAAKVSRRPRGNILTRFVDDLVLKTGWLQKKLGINALTEERPFVQLDHEVAGFEVGFTASHVTSPNAKSGKELIHVVDPSGSSNLEWVVLQKELFAGQRFEVQGPALNTSLEPGELPIGFRLAGIGIVANKNVPGKPESLGYTFELKATEKTVGYYGAMLLPVLTNEAAKLVSGGVGHAVATVFSHAVPGVAAFLAIQSTRTAYRTLHSKKAGGFDKTMAVAHAACDWVRVAFPLAGTLGNVAVAATTIGVALHRAKTGAAGPGEAEAEAAAL